ncbi:hypothetical protein GCM10027217_14450 [Pseudomaricurvus hydrocarbonicus]
MVAIGLFRKKSNIYQNLPENSRVSQELVRVKLVTIRKNLVMSLNKILRRRCEGSSKNYNDNSEYLFVIDDIQCGRKCRFDTVELSGG